jgi:hypothetical protein
MPADPPKPSTPRQDGQLLNFRREFARRTRPVAPDCDASRGCDPDPDEAPRRLPETRAFAANDATAAGSSPACAVWEGGPLDSETFRAEVAPLLAVLGYHLSDPTVMTIPTPPFVERRKAPRTIDRLTELEAQIARHGDPSGLRHRLRRLLLSELELLGVVGRRREDRPLAEAATRALRG